MDVPTQQTRPRLMRSGGIAIDSAIEDPSVCFIETGDSFGFLLAESAFDKDMRRCYILRWIMG